MSVVPISGVSFTVRVSGPDHPESSVQEWLPLAGADLDRIAYARPIECDPRKFTPLQRLYLSPANFNFELQLATSNKRLQTGLPLREKRSITSPFTFTILYPCILLPG